LTIPQPNSGTNPLLKRVTPAEDGDSVFSPFSKNQKKFHQPRLKIAQPRLKMTNPSKKKLTPAED